MTIVRQGELHIISEAAKRTEDLGVALGGLLLPGDVVCLSGELGAGKTVFSRGIGAGWGATTPLSSPSYNLVHEHMRACDTARLYHLDFYRISGAREAETLGIHELLESKNIVIFEWPERILDILPPDHLWIDITMREGEGRDLFFDAQGERHKKLVETFRRLIGISR